jgi:general nucleoside transport system permease protein
MNVSRRPNVGLAVFAALTLLGCFVLPFATLTRGFGGEGAMLVHPARVVDFTGFLPPALPDFGLTTVLIWVTLLALAGTAALAWVRSKWLWVGGALVMVLVISSFAAFVLAVDANQAPLIANGTPYRRLPFQSFGPSLWAFLTLFVGLAAVVSSLRESGHFSGFFNGLTNVLVPGIAILLSLLACGIVILLLQSVPGGEKVTGFAGSWFGKVDLLWFSYSTLFGPIFPKFRPVLDFAPVWQSLSLATPLIFTGLGLAFGFRTGLFNIGAPGQVIMGGIFCAAVGVYVPGPWFIIAPLAVVAAAVGGGFWGAIPGWLKGRFGASEVINTIMLNNIASGVLVFLIGSNEANFFQRTITLPFKAEGGEAKSLEFGAGARLGNLTDPFSVVRDGATILPLPIPLLLIGAVLGWVLSRGAVRDRGLRAGIGAAIGLVLGFVLREIPVTGAMQTAALNFAFVIALLAAGFVGVFLWRTKWGFELRAVGLSPKAAEYGGVNIARNTLLAMAISGALAGLAATHFTMGGALAEYRLKQSIPADSVGFGGITVALLGQNTPVGVVLSSILFGVLGTGGLNLDQRLDSISREIVTVLQALIVLFIATRGFLSNDFFRSINGQKPASTPPPSSPDPMKEPKKEVA